MTTLAPLQQDLAIPHYHQVRSVQPASAPIFSLPFDIIYKIFLLLHTEHPKQLRYIVSSVCQQWRATALDSPLLWTEVTFDNARPRWDKEEEFVRRSANAGLDIVLGCAAFRTSSIKTLKRIMKILLPHTSRWKSLAIFSIPPKVFRILVDAIRHTTFPMLQKLQIGGTVIGGRWKDPALSWSMPALRNLSLDVSPFIHSSPIFDNLHFLCLRTEYTEETSAYTILQRLQGIVARSPSLHTLESLGYIPILHKNPIPHTHRPLLHTCIRRLKAGQGLAEGLFALVHMPSLDTWEVDEWSRPIGSLRMITALSKWPSPCKLQSFEIDGTDHPEEISSLRGALRLLPLLSTLRFSHVDFESRWWPTDISTLCPQLMTLQLDGCSGLTAEDLLSTVQRQPKGDAGVSSITRLEIHGHPQLISVDGEVGRALHAIVELRLQEETEILRGICWACPAQEADW